MPRFVKYKAKAIDHRVFRVLHDKHLSFLSIECIQHIILDTFSTVQTCAASMWVSYIYELWVYIQYLQWRVENDILDSLVNQDEDNVKGFIQIMKNAITKIETSAPTQRTHMQPLLDDLVLKYNTAVSKLISPRQQIPLQYHPQLLKVNCSQCDSCQFSGIPCKSNEPTNFHL